MYCLYTTHTQKAVYTVYCYILLASERGRCCRFSSKGKGYADFCFLSNQYSPQPRFYDGTWAQKKQIDPGKSRAAVQGEETRPTKEKGGRDGFIKYSGRAEVGTCWLNESRPDRNSLGWPPVSGSGGGTVSWNGKTWKEEGEAVITNRQEEQSWLCIHYLTWLSSRLCLAWKSSTS